MSARSKIFITKKKEWMDRNVWADDAKCEKCGRTKNLSLDHIIPSILLVDMGFLEEELKNPEMNWRVLCKICNQFKGHHLDFADKRTAKLMHKFLNEMETPQTLLLEEVLLEGEKSEYH